MSSSRLIVALLVVSAVTACGSSKPATQDDGPPLGMVSAGELTPPERLCDVVRPLPSAHAIESYAAGLTALGISLPTVEEGNDAACALDAFQCRAMHVSVFRTDDHTVQHVGFEDGAGAMFLVKAGFGDPEDGTCGASAAPRADTVFGGPVAVAMRTFGDCQSAMDYTDWLLFDTAGQETFGLLSCQGPSDLQVDDTGKVTVTCLGKTFVVTRDALAACYAG